jgi:hypothetical protein
MITKEGSGQFLRRDIVDEDNKKDELPRGVNFLRPPEHLMGLFWIEQMLPTK